MSRRVSDQYESSQLLLGPEEAPAVLQGLEAGAVEEGVGRGDVLHLQKGVGVGVCG